MSNPTSYAAGIEAAARVAENFAWVEWPSENALATCPDYRRGIADAIRALAQVDRVFASAPGGESGCQFIPKRLFEPAGLDAEGEMILAVFNTEHVTMIRSPYHKDYPPVQITPAEFLKRAASALRPAAPPGAPPVSAPPAESAGEVEHIFNVIRTHPEPEARSAYDAALRRATDDKLQALWAERRQILQDAGADQWELIRKAEAAEAKCRELEGEVARERNEVHQWRGRYSKADEKVDRITRAAQAARDALEEMLSAAALDDDPEENSPELNNAALSAREALATLSAALREGGKE